MIPYRASTVPGSLSAQDAHPPLPRQKGEGREQGGAVPWQPLPPVTHPVQPVVPPWSASPVSHTSPCLRILLFHFCLWSSPLPSCPPTWPPTSVPHPISVFLPSHLCFPFLSRLVFGLCLPFCFPSLIPTCFPATTTQRRQYNKVPMVWVKKDQKTSFFE